MNDAVLDCFREAGFWERERGVSGAVGIDM